MMVFNSCEALLILYVNLKFRCGYRKKHLAKQCIAMFFCQPAINVSHNIKRNKLIEPYDFFVN
jgi:hypothetical protein